MSERLTVNLPDGEYWWGGAVHHGCEMPIHRGSCLTVDQQGEREGDQYASVFLSSRGRFLWSEAAFQARAENGMLCCEGSRPILLSEGFGSLKGAYLAAMTRHFPFSGAMPDPRFFERPQYNTWIEMGVEQTAENILRYARDILAHGMPAGILMIDEGWAEDYGVFEFNRRKIPDPEQLISRLHGMGFTVMLWVTPVVSCAGPRFRQLLRQGFLLLDGQGRPAVREWWNGYSAVLDLTHPDAAAWFHAQLKGLQERFGIDGFKFDAGDRYFYADDDRTYRPVAAREQTQLYNRIGESYPFNEFRAAWNFGGHAIVARLQDKAHRWGARGIGMLIPNTVMQGLLGYAFCCPDMVGGGEIGSFESQNRLDEELFVRWAQASALMGMMQLSIAPWRVLSPQYAALVRAAVDLHVSWGKMFASLARHAAKTGEPIVRAMAYEFPDEGLETVTQQFMIGSEILAAPVIEKQQRLKAVRLPGGRWLGWNGKSFSGGQTVEIPVTLEDIPYFRKL